MQTATTATAHFEYNVDDDDVGYNNNDNKQRRPTQRARERSTDVKALYIVCAYVQCALLVRCHAYIYYIDFWIYKVKIKRPYDIYEKKKSKRITTTTFVVFVCRIERRRSASPLRRTHFRTHTHIHMWRAEQTMCISRRQTTTPGTLLRLVLFFAFFFASYTWRHSHTLSFFLFRCCLGRNSKAAVPQTCWLKYKND